MSPRTEERLFTALVLVVVVGMTALSFSYRAPARLVPLVVGVITSLIMACVAATVFIPRFGRWWSRWERGSIFSLVQQEGEEATGAPSGARRASEFKVLGWLVLLTGAIYLIGFLTSAFLFVLLFLRLAMKESWRMSLGIAVCFLGVVYGVFVVALSIPFPRGVLIHLL